MIETQNPYLLKRLERLNAIGIALSVERDNNRLLEMILFRCIKRGDTKPIAKMLLARFGSFAEVISAAPEPLTSRFRVSPNLVATVLSRPDGPAALKELLNTNHDTVARKRDHKRRAIAVYRSLEAAGVRTRSNMSSSRMRC